MSRNQFYDLEISEVQQLTDQSVCIGFAIPEALKATFAFVPGQYLTLRATIDGQDVRRSYSICSSINDDTLKVGIKHVHDGLFSTEAMNWKAGQTISVMPPQGRFTAELGATHHYLLVAAGSGITPCLSIAASVLEDEPNSQITLIYGNRSSTSIMFRNELNILKDRYTTRFQIFHVLSQEQQDIQLTNGRIDGQKISGFAESDLISIENFSASYLCGPEEMIKDVSSALENLGLPESDIHFELFTTADAPRRIAKTPVADLEETTTVSITLDGTTRQFGLDSENETVLAAAQRAGLDLPFSCEGGMCCTCRCKVVSGTASMDVNYSLQNWEVEAGYTLACQTRSKGKQLVLDFDDA